MAEAAIRIEGLKEFRKALKALDKDLPKALRLAFNVAADIVVADAHQSIPSRSGTAKGTVKARSTQTASRVVGGGRKAPYYPWLDFGGRVGPNRSVHRPFLSDGRYIYPSYRKAKAAGKYQDALSEALIDVAKSAGIEVT